MLVENLFQSDKNISPQQLMMIVLKKNFKKRINGDPNLEMLIE